MSELTRRSCQSCRRDSATGFTIVEFAIALAVFVLAIGAVLIPLGRQVEIRKSDETRRLLAEAQDALLAYASAHGYFPCPASATSNGLEPQPGTDHTTGDCPVWQGFLPAALLGFTPIDSRGYATDAWLLPGNRIRYAISNHAIGGITNPFTRTEGLRMVPIAAVPATPLFYICQSGVDVTAANCGTSGTLTSSAAIVLWSVGPSGANGGTSVHEAQNGSADRVFVSRPYSDVVGNEFDDILMWISGVTIISRLTSAGHVTRRVYTATSEFP